eukprot:gene22534-biopygen4246
MAARGGMMWVEEDLPPLCACLTASRSPGRAPGQVALWNPRCQGARHRSRGSGVAGAGGAAAGRGAGTGAAPGRCHPPPNCSGPGGAAARRPLRRPRRAVTPRGGTNCDLAVGRAEPYHPKKNQNDFWASTRGGGKHPRMYYCEQREQTILLLVLKSVNPAAGNWKLLGVKWYHTAAAAAAAAAIASGSAAAATAGSWEKGGNGRGRVADASHPHDRI